jgi:hypothetical protein
MMDPAKVEDNFPLKIGSQGQHKVDGTVRCIRLFGLEKNDIALQVQGQFLWKPQIYDQAGCPEADALC